MRLQVCVHNSVYHFCLLCQFEKFASLLAILCIHIYFVCAQTCDRVCSLAHALTRRSSTFLLLLFHCSFYYIKLNLFFVVIRFSLILWHILICLCLWLYALYLSFPFFLTLFSHSLSLFLIYTSGTCLFFLSFSARGGMDFCSFLFCFLSLVCTVLWCLFFALHTFLSILGNSSLQYINMYIYRIASCTMYV